MMKKGTGTKKKKERKRKRRTKLKKKGKMSKIENGNEKTNKIAKE